MNINDKQFKQEIEALKEESSPSSLEARIVNAILDPKKNKSRYAGRILGVGISTLLVGAIVFGATMVPRVATAAAVQQVREAFGGVTRYHTRTYNVIEGRRRKVSDSYFEGNRRETFITNSNGAVIKLPEELEQYQENFAGQVIDLSPSQLLDNRKIINVMVMIAPDSISDAIVVDPQELNASQETQNSGKDKPTKNSVNEIQVVPAFIGGEYGIESLRILLKNEDLWVIEHGIILNGHYTDCYELKKGTIKFVVFVDATSKLPLLTRQTLEIEGEPLITEVEYDYGGTLPPKDFSVQSIKEE
ncbi:MAG: hypothetical protein KF824_11220 [Fimbriimonadaceae bacterium]|nr:MAG: hypothetical protein KF824_11220 [Fimbriimonadaceae bacterium]